MTTTRIQLTGFTERPDEMGDLRQSILACLFGSLVEHATPVVTRYHSDLFHDAAWLIEHVHGSTTFDWLARPCGTNIGPAARVGVEIGPGDGARFYRITVAPDRRGMWWATFADVPLNKVRDLPPASP